MAGDRVRAEVRAAVAKLVEEQKTPLSLVEKDRVIEEILDEAVVRDYDVVKLKVLKRKPRF
jgi:hypothetical protein